MVVGYGHKKAVTFAQIADIQNADRIMAKEIQKVPFQGSLYDYKVSLGTVLSPNSVSWDLHITVEEWAEVRTLVESWHESQQYPAFAVDLDYKGDRIIETPRGSGNYQKLSELI